MAVTLATAAALSANDLQVGVVETFVDNSPVLARIPLLNVTGNAYAYNVEAALPGVEFRAVNSAYAESTGTVNQRTETLVILGGDADVDTYIVKTRGNLNDQRAIQTRMKSKALAFKYQDTFINGDTAVDANSFDGLKKRLTGAQVVDAGVNGTGPVAGGQAFFDFLDQAIAAVVGGPDVLLMNASVLQRIQSSARRLNTALPQSLDDFGRQVTTYNGIPLVDVGNKADGTAIIPQTETQGTSTNASSIYAVRFTEDESEPGAVALDNGGVDVRDLGEQNAKPVYRTRIEWFNGLALFGAGAARLRGVLNA